MSREQIISLPDPRLRQPSQRLAAVDPQTGDLAKQMIAATLDWEDHRPHEVGVAMAAVQLGQPYRLIIVRQDFGQKQNREFEVFINPKIIKSEGEPAVDAEGCLSIPDIYGLVPRYPKIKVEALDLAGRRLRLTAEGFLARVLQHEIDHLSGKLFIDRVEGQQYLKINQAGELTPLKDDEIKAHPLLRQ